MKNRNWAFLYFTWKLVFVSTMQFFESHYQRKCLVKVWRFSAHPLHISKFQMAIVKNFIEHLRISKVLMTFYYITNDYCQKFYWTTNFFIMDFKSSYDVLLHYKYFWSIDFFQWNKGPFKTFWNFARKCKFCFFIFSKWKKYYNLTFTGTFQMYFFALC